VRHDLRDAARVPHFAEASTEAEGAAENTPIPGQIAPTSCELPHFTATSDAERASGANCDHCNSEAVIDFGHSAPLVM
jgi:hypothetical protein